MVDILMPQMGESIAEGTVTKWLKKVGERVARDEPLLEISTDKVDAEIPSPAAGVLKEIKVPEGNTVPVNSVLGVLADEAHAAAAPPASAAAPPPARPPAPPAPPAPAAAPPAAAPAPAPPAPPVRPADEPEGGSPTVRMTAPELAAWGAP